MHNIKRLNSGYENGEARIEMLPLIDVVFLLLVFFIYAMISLVAHRDLPVRLPAAATAKTPAPDFVTITVTAENQIMVEGQPASIQTLIKLVRARLKKPDGLVRISGDRRSDLGISISILGKLRAAGIKRAAFEVLPENGARPQ
jgi:biopolymer transport protein ExbD